MKECLQSEQGKKMYLRRMHPVESIFGHWKHNLAYTQFLLRGIKKVEAEFMLICLTQNLRLRVSINRHSGKMPDMSINFLKIVTSTNTLKYFTKCPCSRVLGQPA